MSGGTNSVADQLRRFKALVESGVPEREAINLIADECDVQPKSIQRKVQEWRKGDLRVPDEPKPKLSDLPRVEPPKPEGVTPAAIPAPAATKQPPELISLVSKAIKNTRRTVSDLADQFSVPPKDVVAALDALRERSVIVDEFSDGVQLGKDLKPVDEPHRIDVSLHREVEIPIGLIGDTHIGSKYERLDVAEALYDRFAAYGVERVYHCGNWIDGECRFNKHDIYVTGFEGQIRNFVEKYPRREGIITGIVSGDDHEGWYVQREGINVGHRMEQTASEMGRSDLIDLGYMERNIELQQAGGSQTLRVIHAGGGSAYAISYSDQKYAESLQGGEKPRIVAVGHFHKFNVGYPREIFMVQVGCCEDQTPFMRKKKLQAMVGGVVLWVRQREDGIIQSIKHEWIPFYDRKFYAYKWEHTA